MERLAKAVGAGGLISSIAGDFIGYAPFWGLGMGCWRYAFGASFWEGIGVGLTVALIGSVVSALMAGSRWERIRQSGERTWFGGGGTFLLVSGVLLTALRWFFW